MYLFKLEVLSFPNICPGIAESYGYLYFQFLRNLHSIFHSSCTKITFPPTLQADSLFFTPSPSFVICRLFNDVDSDWFEVIPHCEINLNFSNNYGYYASFHVLIGHLYVFFGEMSTQVFCPFFDWVVWFFVVVVFIELYNLFIYFGNETFVSHIILVLHLLAFTDSTQQIITSFEAQYCFFMFWHFTYHPLNPIYIMFNVSWMWLYYDQNYFIFSVYLKCRATCIRYLPFKEIGHSGIIK